MKENTTFSFGNQILVNKIDAKYAFFEQIFGNLPLKVKNFKEFAKLLVCNKLGKSVAINRILSVYPSEFFENPEAAPVK